MYFLYVYRYSGALLYYVFCINQIKTHYIIFRYSYVLFGGVAHIVVLGEVARMLRGVAGVHVRPASSCSGRGVTSQRAALVWGYGICVDVICRWARRTVWVLCSEEKVRVSFVLYLLYS